MMVVVMVLQHE